MVALLLTQLLQTTITPLDWENGRNFQKSDITF